MNGLEALKATALEAASGALDRAASTAGDVQGSPIGAIVDDRPVRFDVVATAYCTGARARELIARHRLDKVVPMLVADRITAGACNPPGPSSDPWMKTNGCWTGGPWRRCWRWPSTWRRIGLVGARSWRTGDIRMPSGGDAVLLPGPAMVPLVRAAAAFEQAGINRYAIVGGIAVTARLGQAHRATTDIDAVVDETHPPDAVAALLELPSARPDPTGAHRVRIGGVKVELLPVAPTTESDLDGLPQREALFVAAHAWAVETATRLRLIDGSVREELRGAPASLRALVA